jgi:phage terminase large subunit-like protein
VIETRPTSNKLAYFMSVVPLLTGGEILFPIEHKESIELKEMMHEFGLATPQGLKAKHDDCIDGTSRLMNIVPVKPGLSVIEEIVSPHSTIWDMPAQTESTSLKNYIV